MHGPRRNGSDSQLTEGNCPGKACRSRRPDKSANLVDALNDACKLERNLSTAAAFLFDLLKFFPLLSTLQFAAYQANKNFVHIKFAKASIFLATSL